MKLFRQADGTVLCAPCYFWKHTHGVEGCTSARCTCSWKPKENHDDDPEQKAGKKPPAT
jgi:hypothetical protein